MRRLTFLVAALLAAGCYGAPAGSAPPTPGAPSPAVSADPTSTPAPSPACPTGVLSVQQLNESDLSCHGGRDVTVRGFLGGPPIMGWEPPGIEPAWLWIPSFQGKQTLWQAGPPPSEYCAGDDCGSGGAVLIYIPPTSDLKAPAVEGWFLVTGHRMDPAAEQCHWDYGTEAVPEPTLNDEDARQSCRRSFVVTAIDKGAAPSALPSPTRAPAKSPTPSPSPTEAAGACDLRSMLALSGHDPAWPMTAVDCLGRSETRVTGWLADPWGIGWGPSGIEPAWLGDMVAIERVLWLNPCPADGSIADTDCAWLHLHSRNAGQLPLSGDRWVTITGHFDDPAAATCQWTGPEGTYSMPLSRSEAVAACRSSFVVTAIDDAAPPGNQIP